MARFSFSIAGRKKQPVHPPTHLPHTSKAHRILGSTPLTIDAPAAWDNASISITTDDRSATAAAARYSESDLGTDDDIDDDQVVFANEDEVWGEASEIAHPLRLNAVNAPTPTKTAPTDTTGRLRMSRSLSTIRSWYDKSKLPPSPSQQTSSSSVAKGLPAYTSDEGTARTTKKKPAMLDLSRARIQEERDTVGSGPWTTSRMDRMLRSPSLLPPLFSSRSTQSCESRKPTRKNINETLQIPAPETPRSTRSGSGRLGRGSPSDLPSLYDHYEQMSIRKVMNQISTPNLQVTGDGQLMLENVAEGEYEDEVNDFEIYPCRSTPDFSETPRTGLVLGSDWQSSPGGAAPSVSSRQTKTSKNTERSLEGRDLLQTSVLMLSSDSEQEDDDDEDDEDLEEPGLFAAGQCPTSASSRRPYNAPRRFSSSTESRSRSARDTVRPGADCGASCSSRQGKRTSFAENNTYIIVPSYESRRDAPGGVASGSPTDCGDRPLSLNSSTSSVMSDHSNSSAATWQDESGYDIQEARAITMLPARRPSDIAIETRHTASSVAGDGVLKSPGLCRASSEDQLTPSLSPTSVDFYIGSAHSSIDSSGGHSRLMAVTPQEEMLLSALRNKQQSSRHAPMSQVSEGNERGNDKIKETEEKIKSTAQAGHAIAAPDSADSPVEEDTAANGHRSKGSQTITTFGFPAPPSSPFPESTHSQEKRTVDARKRLVPPILTSGFGPGVAVVPPSPSGPPPNMSLPELPKARKSIRYSASHETASTQTQQEVPLFIDDVEPRPDLDDIRDWESATSPVVEPTLSPSAPRTMLWRDEDNQSESGGSPASSPRADSPAVLHPHSFSRPNVRKQDLAGKEDKEGVHHPDSRVSLESFPPVPTKRTTRNNMARLSAFGPGSLTNVGEFGWWGDDD